MTTSEKEPPIACQLHALSAGERQRQKELLGTLVSKVLRVVEIDDGFALQLPSDPATFMEIAEWVGLERRCCAFADFAIHSRRDDTVSVHLSGGPGAKDVLFAEMGLAKAAARTGSPLAGK
jgi:hypothetical protein